ncbi:hypothetical protein [Fictibacillus fluitans]|uniref:Uncharacterized protein n=1 Tax=Fictibacillus fluitans TaxID=3058422 RepID=A0ABT8HUL8_9BACL|nr:hypothetical protein [Fictibacillus sp. NE201]MDN4524438.1 hypothetical protein [Fictibacillus sp. NE201]
MQAIRVFTCLLVMALVYVPNQSQAKASGENDEGFVISADRVEGGIMIPQVVMGETSTGKSKPMIRFQYRNATLYGMKLTKVLSTDEGPVTVIMQAHGPVHMTNMSADASAFSLKGACLTAGKPIPDPGLKKVTMLVHKMEASKGELDRLTLTTVKGNHGQQRPDAPKVLQDLASLPLLEAKEAVGKLMNGHLPLTCEDKKEEKENSSVKPSSPFDDAKKALPVPSKVAIKKPDAKPDKPDTKHIVKHVKKPLDDAADPVKRAKKPLKDVADPVKRVKKPIDNVAKPVKDHVEKPVKKVSKVINKTKETANRETKKIKKTVQQTKQQLCSETGKLNGSVPKMFGLRLIDEAQKEKVALSSLCPNDKAATKQLKIVQSQLLKNLNLPSLEKDQLADPDLLNKMEKEIESHSALKLLPDLLKPLDGLF